MHAALLPQYGELFYQSRYAHSSYEGLQLTFQKRYSKTLSILANYTWSHSFDNVHNNEDNTGGMVPQDPNNTNAEKAESGFDIRQRFVTVYNLPIGRRGAFWATIGWIARFSAGGRSEESSPLKADIHSRQLLTPARPTQPRPNVLAGSATAISIPVNDPSTVVQRFLLYRPAPPIRSATLRAM